MRSVSLGMGQHLSVTWDPVRNAGFQALPQTCCTRNLELGCRNLCSNTPGDKGCRYSWRTTGLGVNKDKYWEWLSSSLWSVSCPPHFVCHRALSSWAMGCVHRTRLYTSEFFSSVSTCGKKRQNPLSPMFSPRTYFFISVVHTRIYLILQRGWSSFLLSGFTVLPLSASVGSVLWPYSLETPPPVGLTSVHRPPRWLQLWGGPVATVWPNLPWARSHHLQVESSMLSATELGLLEIASKNRQPYIAPDFFLIEVQLNTTIYSVKFCHTAELFSNLYMYTFFFNIHFHYGFYRILNVPNSKTLLCIHPVYSNYFCFTPASLSIPPHLAPLGNTSLFSVSASLSHS